MTYFKFFLQVFINFAKLQTDMLDEEIDEIYPASGEHFIIIIVVVVGVGVIFLGPMFHLHRGREWDRKTERLDRESLGGKQSEREGKDSKNTFRCSKSKCVWQFEYIVKLLTDIIWFHYTKTCFVTEPAVRTMDVDEQSIVGSTVGLIQPGSARNSIRLTETNHRPHDSEA